MSDKAAKKVAELCRTGVLDRKCLERWWFCSRISELSPSTMEELVELQLRVETDAMWSNAVHMCHTYYLNDGNVREFREDFLFDLLTHQALVDERQSQEVGHYWSRLSKAFLDRYPGRKWSFFEQVLSVGTKHWAVLHDLDMNEDRVLSAIVRSDPVQAWQCIADVYKRDDRAGMFGVGHWLSDGGHGFDESPGPIQLIPSEVLFGWIDDDVDDRAYWIARVLPKTLSNSEPGRLTRSFIARYCKNKDVSSAVWAHFHARGWCGSASEHYRSMRDEARTWLSGEKNSIVKRWIEDYIESLNHDIERAEIEEERRLY